MKKDKEICASFAVELQTAKVTATACDEHLVKMEKALNLYNRYFERERERDHTHISFIIVQFYY